MSDQERGQGRELLDAPTIAGQTHAHTHTLEHFLCASTVLQEVRAVADFPDMTGSGIDDKLKIKMELSWSVNSF